MAAKRPSFKHGNTIRSEHKNLPENMAASHSALGQPGYDDRSGIRLQSVMVAPPVDFTSSMKSGGEATGPA